jgi:uncharacterized protein YbaR (Trm112 family)
MKALKVLPVATFNEIEPARELCRELEGAGIETHVNDETKLEKFWFLSEPLAAIHVEVKAKDFLRAQQLLTEWGDACKPMHQAVRCPECGSSRIEFPQITRKFLMPMAARLFMALHLMPREFYCQNCQYTWPIQESVPPKLDNLNWPVNSHMGDPKTARPARTS